MTRIAFAIVFGSMVLSATVAYLGRYETTQGAGQRYFITDRWTGTVSACVWIGGYSICNAAYPPRSPPRMPMTESEAEKFLDGK